MLGGTERRGGARRPAALLSAEAIAAERAVDVMPLEYEAYIPMAAGSAPGGGEAGNFSTIFHQMVPPPMRFFEARDVRPYVKRAYKSNSTQSYILAFR